MSECKTKCPMCDKRGLPVLLTRYVIAPVEAHARQVSGDFAVSRNIPLGDHAIYTQRLLRSGYLYVHDEKQKKWEAYFVSPDAYLMPIALPAEDRLTPTVTGNPEEIRPCSRNASATVAGCITISSPEKAGIVWLAFSDVEWTSGVLALHQEATYRAKHMRAFDVKKWLASTKHAHAGKVDQVASVVAEYVRTVPAQAFDFSPARKAMRLGSQSGQSLIDNCETMMPGKGVIVAVDDPAGIAMDLGTLMDHKLHQFSLAQQHPLAVSTAIIGLKESIEHQAELAELDAARTLQSRMLGENPLIGMTERGRKMLDRAGTVSRQDLEKCRLSAWDKYLKKPDGKPRYKESQRQTFQKKYDNDLKKFSDTQIAPLAIAHSQWMQCSDMAENFACNFDEKNIESGKVYTSVLNLCIGNTQDKIACSEVYEKWLAGSVSDKKNLLLRGLLLNQEEFTEVVAKGTAVSTDPRGLPWSSMIGFVGKGIDSALENKPDILGALMLRVGGATLKVFTKHAESGALPEALVAMGVVSKTPVLRIEFVGNMRDFQKYAIGELLKARGESMPPRGMLKAIDDEIKLLEIKGANLDGTRSKKFLVLADLDTLNAVPATGNQSERAKAFAKTLANIDDLRNIEMSRWRKNLESRLTRVRDLAGRGQVALPYAFSVLGAIAQLYAQGKLAEDLEKAIATENGIEENKWRYWAGWTAFGGTVAETLAKGVENSTRITLRFGHGIGQLLPKLVSWAGRAAGVFGAGIMAFFDLNKGFNEINKGNKGLGYAYISASALGFTGAMIIMMPFAAATVIGIVIIALAASISVLIEIIKDNPLQEWLKSCFFGEYSFSSADAEIQALRKAGGY